MTLKTLRIGSAEDVYQYDDGSFSSAIETTEPIKAGTPTVDDEVLRLGDIFPALTDAISAQSYFFARIH